MVYRTRLAASEIRLTHYCTNEFSGLPIDVRDWSRKLLDVKRTPRRGLALVEVYLPWRVVELTSVVCGV